MAQLGGRFVKLKPNLEIEKEFIQTFIIKNRRDRFIWELSTPRKRESRLWDFHRLQEYLIPGMVFPVNYWREEIIIKKLLEIEPNPQYIYIINEGYAGCTTLEELRQVKFVTTEDEFLIYFGNGLAYYQDGFEFYEKRHEYFLLDRRRQADKQKLGLL